jgi:hypothetical protein
MVIMNTREILAALKYGTSKGNNSSNLFLEGKSFEKWEEIRTLPFYKEMLKEVYNESDNYMQSPIKALRYSTYKIFDSTGSRKEFEKEYFERRGRLNTYAILTMIDGKQEHIDALQDIIWVICDEFTWCLPAHHGGTSIQVKNLTNKIDSTGKLNSFIREQRETVDLFAAETGFALSEILSITENKLDPIIVYRARKEIKERILEPYMNINKYFWWESSTNNWSAVCASSVGASALYLIDDDEALVPIVQRILATLECFLEGYEDDGACTEGLGYWVYGFGFFVCFASLLKQRTAGVIDLLKSEKVKQIMLFQQKCYLSGNKIISFSDAGLTSKFTPGLTYYLNSICEEVEIPPLEYRASFTDDHCFRWAHNIRNFVWINPQKKANGIKPASYYLEDSQWFISRSGDNLCLVVKGGHNNEPHNHNDVGNFILHVNGESLLTDIGSGEYTKQYFGDERYSILCNGSQGHSVPIVEGLYQECGRKYAAKDMKIFQCDEYDKVSMDISGAYNSSNLRSLIRNFTFYKKNSKKLIIEDNYIFENEPLSVIERFISFNKAEIVSDGKLVIKGDNSIILLTYDPEQFKCNIIIEKHINHQARLVNVSVINLELKSPEKNVNAVITVQI